MSSLASDFERAGSNIIRLYKLWYASQFNYEFFLSFVAETNIGQKMMLKESLMHITLEVTQYKLFCLRIMA